MRKLLPVADRGKLRFFEETDDFVMFVIDVAVSDKIAELTRDDIMAKCEVKFNPLRSFDKDGASTAF